DRVVPRPRLLHALARRLEFYFAGLEVTRRGDLRRARVDDERDRLRLARARDDALRHEAPQLRLDRGRRFRVRIAERDGHTPVAFVWHARGELSRRLDAVAAGARERVARRDGHELRRRGRVPEGELQRGRIRPEGGSAGQGNETGEGA